MSRILRIAVSTVLVLATLFLGGCTNGVGVGIGVDIPVGDHGYISLGSGRWY